jgi:arylformamidase
MRYLLFIAILFAFSSCSTKKLKNITYTTSIQNNPLQLNVFVPRKAEGKKLPVLIYVHGGNWNSGNKNIYGFFGRNFAKKNVITVITSYTLSPDATYDQMASEIASAIKWVETDIEKYGGHPKKLFVTGHSAGGHLVALATMNPKYGVEEGTVSGIILNDAAGLDMKHYLEQIPPTSENDYLNTWTNNPKEWKNASPIYFLNDKTPPFLIYVGTKTYPSIKVANERFVKKLNTFQKDITPVLVDKKHIPMILQYFWPWNDRIDETVDFMQKVSN